MKHSRTLKKLRSNRLRGYDYSQPGAYFATICTQDKECIFGDVVDGRMILNRFGKIVEEEWIRSEAIRREIVLDCWIVMPNHVHGIVWITDFWWERSDARKQAPSKSESSIPTRAAKSLSTFVSGFKSAVSRRINKMRGTPGKSVWQTNYHDHIIRDEDDLNNKRQYILDNPARWEHDKLNPKISVGAHGSSPPGTISHHT